MSYKCKKGNSMKKFGLILGLCLMCLAGCACPPKDPEALHAYEEANDPLEPLNRSMFAFNMAVDNLVLEPVAKGYRAVTPQIARTGIRNFFKNLKQPVYFANAVFQLEGEQALSIAGRFLSNTLFGFFGFADTASELDIPVYEPDFGQTLYVWGIKEAGPYLVLPVLGPSNPRDAIGWGVDSVMAPLDWALKGEPVLLYSKFAVESFSKREGALEFLDSLEKGSTDFYATMRSMYRQNRKNKLENSNVIIGYDQVVQKKEYEFDLPSDDEFEEE